MQSSDRIYQSLIDYFRSRANLSSSPINPEKWSIENSAFESPVAEHEIIDGNIDYAALFFLTNYPNESKNMIQREVAKLGRSSTNQIANQITNELIRKITQEYLYSVAIFPNAMNYVYIIAMHNNDKCYNFVKTSSTYEAAVSDIQDIYSKVRLASGAKLVIIKSPLNSNTGNQVIYST